MAVAYNKFESFVNVLGLGDHHLDSDTFNVYVTNNAPSASADDVRADLVGATEENGYAAADITNTWSEANGTGTMGATDVVITATGAVGPFQYVVIYNDTHASDALMCWWDYGSEVTMADGETFTIDFVDNAIMTLA
jgi:hypothetical protein